MNSYVIMNTSEYILKIYSGGFVGGVVYELDFWSRIVNEPSAFESFFQHNGISL